MLLNWPDFFRVVPVRIPVLIPKGDSAKAARNRHDRVRYRGRMSVCLWAAAEFDDVVQVKTADGTLDSTAKIVAMRLHDDKMAFAARFLNDVTNWIARAECRNVGAASGN